MTADAIVLCGGVARLIGACPFGSGGVAADGAGGTEWASGGWDGQ